MREDLCKACGEELIFKGTMRDGGQLVCPRCDMGEGASASVTTDPEYGQPADPSHTHTVTANPNWRPSIAKSLLYRVDDEDDGAACLIPLDGRVLRGEDYPELYKLLSSWADTPGGETFRLPDLRQDSLCPCVVSSGPGVGDFQWRYTGEVAKNIEAHPIRYVKEGILYALR